MNITHDKVSGALYIRLGEGEYDHTEDFSEKADVHLDVDADGNVLGLEALSFEDLAQAIEERGGKLEVPDRVGGLVGDTPDSDNKALLEAVSSLEPRDQEILRMLFLDGMNILGVAEHLKIPLADAHRARSSALVRLRAELDEREAGVVDHADLEALLSRL